MNIEDFKMWDLTIEDFKMSRYSKICEGVIKYGIRIEVIPYEISVSSHSRKNNTENKKQCLNMLYAIFSNAMIL